LFASILDVFAGNFQEALVDESKDKSDERTEHIRNDRGARVALCVHPTRINNKGYYTCPLLLPF
jgi:hypothetical protein